LTHFVYILRSLKDLGYYIGETKNVIQRLEFHNKGLQRSTKHRIPFEIVLIEEFPSRKEALKREKELKSWKGGIKFKQLIKGSSPARRDTTFGT
jgi:putative endonuclease